MKQALQKHRKSFKKWAMPGQRTQTLDAENISEQKSVSKYFGRNFENVGKNNGGLKLSIPARNLSTMFTLRNIRCFQTLVAFVQNQFLRWHTTRNKKNHHDAIGIGLESKTNRHKRDNQRDSKTTL
jgi:hypothetical protein